MKAILIPVMLLLGFGSLACLGWIVNIGRSESRLPALTATTTDPLAIARDGVLLSIRSARAALADGRQTSAAMALDAAKRSADVAKHASSSDPAFSDAYDGIERARRALDDGDYRGAAARLEETAGRLATAGGDGAVRRPAAAEMAPYDDAVVLDPRGVRIGELVTSADAREPDSVGVVMGGGRDVLGFIDLGGRRTTVRTGDLLFGERRTIGPTMVTLLHPANF